MTELVVAALVGAAGAVLAALVDRSNRRADSAAGLILRRPSALQQLRWLYF